MEIIITAWALDSYLELRDSQTFSAEDYREIIRPDALLLISYPNHPKFMNGKFWSIASDDGGQIAAGFKMKWHNLGSQRNQLRLLVGMFNEAYLCQSYVKNDSKKERRMLAKFKTHLALIEMGRFTDCGRLS
jgi:hypothetical protein